MVVSSGHVLQSSPMEARRIVMELLRLQRILAPDTRVETPPGERDAPHDAVVETRLQGDLQICITLLY